ncbi:MAG: hypothetical protein MRY21_07270 [Simkaniaceae bacterium]|nr:hypothetical protein [Simkaniaceae bacterium]
MASRVPSDASPLKPLAERAAKLLRQTNQLESKVGEVALGQILIAATGLYESAGALRAGVPKLTRRAKPAKKQAVNKLNTIINAVRAKTLPYSTSKKSYQISFQAARRLTNGITQRLKKPVTQQELGNLKEKLAKAKDLMSAPKFAIPIPDADLSAAVNTLKLAIEKLDAKLNGRSEETLATQAEPTSIGDYFNREESTITQTSTTLHLTRSTTRDQVETFIGSEVPAHNGKIAIQLNLQKKTFHVFIEKNGEQVLFRANFNGKEVLGTNLHEVLNAFPELTVKRSFMQVICGKTIQAQVVVFNKTAPATTYTPPAATVKGARPKPPTSLEHEQGDAVEMTTVRRREPPAPPSPQEADIQIERQAFARAETPSPGISRFFRDYHLSTDLRENHPVRLLEEYTQEETTAQRRSQITDLLDQNFKNIISGAYLAVRASRGFGDETNTEMLRAVRNVLAKIEMQRPEVLELPQTPPARPEYGEIVSLPQMPSRAIHPEVQQFNLSNISDARAYAHLISQISPADSASYFDAAVTGDENALLHLFTSTTPLSMAIGYNYEQGMSLAQAALTVIADSNSTLSGKPVSETVLLQSGIPANIIDMAKTTTMSAALIQHYKDNQELTEQVVPAIRQLKLASKTQGDILSSLKEIGMSELGLAILSKYFEITTAKPELNVYTALARACDFVTKEIITQSYSRASIPSVDQFLEEGNTIEPQEYQAMLASIPSQDLNAIETIPPEKMSEAFTNRTLAPATLKAIAHLYSQGLAIDGCRDQVLFDVLQNTTATDRNLIRLGISRADIAAAKSMSFETLIQGEITSPVTQSIARENLDTFSQSGNLKILSKRLRIAVIKKFAELTRSPATRLARGPAPSQQLLKQAGHDVKTLVNSIGPVRPLESAALLYEMYETPSKLLLDKFKELDSDAHTQLLEEYSIAKLSGQERLDAMRSAVAAVLMEFFPNAPETYQLIDSSVSNHDSGVVADFQDLETEEKANLLELVLKAQDDAELGSVMEQMKAEDPQLYAQFSAANLQSPEQTRQLATVFLTSIDPVRVFNQLPQEYQTRFEIFQLLQYYPQAQDTLVTIITTQSSQKISSLLKELPSSIRTLIQHKAGGNSVEDVKRAIHQLHDQFITYSTLKNLDEQAQSLTGQDPTFLASLVNDDDLERLNEMANTETSAEFIDIYGLLEPLTQSLLLELLPKGEFSNGARYRDAARLAYDCTTEVRKAPESLSPSTTASTPTTATQVQSTPASTPISDDEDFHAEYAAAMSQIPDSDIGTLQEMLLAYRGEDLKLDATKIHPATAAAIYNRKEFLSLSMYDAMTTVLSVLLDSRTQTIPAADNSFDALINSGEGLSPTKQEELANMAQLYTDLPMINALKTDNERQAISHIKLLTAPVKQLLLARVAGLSSEEAGLVELKRAGAEVLEMLNQVKAKRSETRASTPTASSESLAPTPAPDEFTSPEPMDLIALMDNLEARDVLYRYAIGRDNAPEKDDALVSDPDFPAELLAERVPEGASKSILKDAAYELLLEVARGCELAPFARRALESHVELYPYLDLAHYNEGEQILETGERVEELLDTFLDTDQVPMQRTEAIRELVSLMSDHDYSIFVTCQTEAERAFGKEVTEVTAVNYNIIMRHALQKFHRIKKTEFKAKQAISQVRDLVRAPEFTLNIRAEAGDQVTKQDKSNIVQQILHSGNVVPLSSGDFTQVSQSGTDATLRLMKAARHAAEIMLEKQVMQEPPREEVLSILDSITSGGDVEENLQALKQTSKSFYRLFKLQSSAYARVSLDDRAEQTRYIAARLKRQLRAS